MRLIGTMNGRYGGLVGPTMDARALPWTPLEGQKALKKNSPKAKSAWSIGTQRNGPCALHVGQRPFF